MTTQTMLPINLWECLTAVARGRADFGPCISMDHVKALEESGGGNMELTIQATASGWQLRVFCLYHPRTITVDIPADRRAMPTLAVRNEPSNADYWDFLSGAK